MFGIHAGTSTKSEGGLSSAWLRRQWCLHTGYFTASALAYHIGLELLRGDWKLRMIGNFTSLARDELTAVQLCKELQIIHSLCARAGRLAADPLLGWTSACPFRLPATNLEFSPLVPPLSLPGLFPFHSPPLPSPQL